MVKAYVVYGLGTGCHGEVAHAFEKAGAEAELVHFRQLLEQGPGDAQIINFSGGFLHGDMGGAGMYAANEMEHAEVMTEDGEKKFKELLLDFTQNGGLVYGQCNGFQLLVRTGLLPGVNEDYSKQTVALTHNDCGNYWVAPVLHMNENGHFAFRGIEEDLWLWCRHAEGKIQFYSEHGLVSKEEGEATRAIVNKYHVLLRYANPETKEATEKFPHNPNGSIDGIAGLVNYDGTIFGHMAHTELIYASRDPRWFAIKDQLRRKGVKAKDLDGKVMEGVSLQVFRNIVRHFD